MNECVYNYSLEDNLKATEQLLIFKNKRRTNIVTLLLIFLCMVGILVTAKAIAEHTNNWFVGIVSVLLLICYFFAEKIIIKNLLKKQKQFFLNSNLISVTKVKVSLEDQTIKETFLKKESIIGTNNYNVNDLTCLKIQKDNLYLIFNDEFIVLLKLQCMSEKTRSEFLKLKEKFTRKNIKGKSF